MADRPMKAIPISAAQSIADEYGYDHVIVYARRVGESPAPHGEHMTTYGVDKVHCDAAARIGRRLQELIWKASGGEGTVADISDEELVRRAAQRARDTTQSKRAKHPRWVAVMHTFALGSTYAAQLCRRFGLDPDEQVRQ